MATIVCSIGHTQGTKRRELYVSVHDGRGSKRFNGLPELVGHVLIGLDFDLEMFLLYILSMFEGHLTSEEVRELQCKAESLWKQEFGLSSLNLSQL